MFIFLQFLLIVSAIYWNTQVNRLWSNSSFLNFLVSFLLVNLPIIRPAIGMSYYWMPIFSHQDTVYKYFLECTNVPTWYLAVEFISLWTLSPIWIGTRVRVEFFPKAIKFLVNLRETLSRVCSISMCTPFVRSVLRRIVCQECTTEVAKYTLLSLRKSSLRRIISWDSQRHTLLFPSIRLTKNTLAQTNKPTTVCVMNRKV